MSKSSIRIAGSAAPITTDQVSALLGQLAENFGLGFIGDVGVLYVYDADVQHWTLPMRDGLASILQQTGGDVLVSLDLEVQVDQAGVELAVETKLGLTNHTTIRDIRR